MTPQQLQTALKRDGINLNLDDCDDVLQFMQHLAQIEYTTYMDKKWKKDAATEKEEAQLSNKEYTRHAA